MALMSGVGSNGSSPLDHSPLVKTCGTILCAGSSACDQCTRSTLKYLTFSLFAMEHNVIPQKNLCLPDNMHITHENI